MPKKIAMQRKKAALRKLYIKHSMLEDDITPMLDLNNYVAANVDHRYHDKSK